MKKILDMLRGSMTKSVVKIGQEKLIGEKIKKALSENHACYVLITCSDPTKEGKMDVEMSYGGDECLAAFLIDNASQVFDEKLAKSK